MIKEKVIEYRNSHKESRVLLGVLLGEFERLEKNPKWVNKEIPESEYLAIIKKLVASNIECKEFEENKILELFLPQMLTDLEIIKFININNFPNLGECMKWFKTNHAALYNGAIVSNIYKNTLLWQG